MTDDFPQVDDMCGHKNDLKRLFEECKKLHFRIALEKVLNKYQAQLLLEQDDVQIKIIALTNEFIDRKQNLDREHESDPIGVPHLFCDDWNSMKNSPEHYQKLA